MILIELRHHCRAILTDTTDYPNDSLDAWIREAIALYSSDFPRRLRYTLSLTTGTQAYVLPGGHDFQAITQVEYPSGSWPPTIIDQAEEWSVAFQSGDPVYSLRPPADTATASTDDDAWLIVFAETVATGESAIIDYTTTHRLPDIGDDDCYITVPAWHIEAITAYVQFRAFVYLQTEEAMDVSNISIVLAQLGDEANQAWRHYRQVLERLQYSSSATSARSDWSGGLDERSTW